FDLGIYDSNGECSCDSSAYKKRIKEDTEERSFSYNRAFFEIEEYEIFQIVKKS
ncbi:17389_t:CDS:1, partial [Racocetra persica]